MLRYIPGLEKFAVRGSCIRQKRKQSMRMTLTKQESCRVQRPTNERTLH